MSDSNRQSSLASLLAALGDAPDVRAALDARTPEIAPATLGEIKLEIDRLMYADLPAAARLAEVADWGAGRNGDGVSRAYAELARARLLHAEARYGEAEALYASATASLRASGLSAEAAVQARQHVEALMFVGRYREAFELARSARTVLKAHPDPSQLAKHETNMGNLYFHLDRHREALERYTAAHQIFSRLGDEAALAYLDHNRAAVLAEMDEFAEAMSLYKRAGAAYRKMGMIVRALQVDLAGAYIDFLRGHYHTALRRLDAAEADGAGVLNDADRGMTDLDRAEVYLHLNAFPEAAAAAERAGERFARAGMAREAGAARRMLAAATVGLGDEARGVALFAEAAALFDESGQKVQGALVRLDLAEAAARRGDWGEALDALDAAELLLARTRLAQARRRARLLRARALFARGDVRGASSHARATLKGAERAGDESVAAHCHYLLGSIAASRQQRVMAIVHFRLAVNLFDGLRARAVVDDFKSSFLLDKAGLYEEAVRLALDERTPEALADAFLMLEKAKSRSLADLLSQYVRECLAPSGETSEVHLRFARLVEELTWFKARRERAPNGGGGQDGTRLHQARHTKGVARLEARVAEAFRELQASDERFAAMQCPQPVGPAELRRVVGEGEALVEYFTAKDEVLAIVATKDGLRCERGLASLSRVEALLDGLTAQFENFAFGREFADRQLAHLRLCADAYLARLYDALLRPLEALVGDRDLVVVPHGRLHGVPFHALFDGARYVVERRGVSYAPSATVFALCRAKRRREGGRTLLVGLADRSAPAISAEIEALRAIFPAASVLAGADATRGALAREVGDCSVLHIASHARFRADNPLLSSLRLADGEITFYDVIALRLSADLVVLSGCDTGAVAVAAGDELQGLIRGFLYAGAPSLVVSMWAADDPATAESMKVFYEALRDGRSARDALRLAQLAALGRYGHPYYWAPFALHGSPC